MPVQVCIFITNIINSISIKPYWKYTLKKLWRIFKYELEKDTQKGNVYKIHNGGKGCKLIRYVHLYIYKNKNSAEVVYSI